MSIFWIYFHTNVTILTVDIPTNLLNFNGNYYMVGYFSLEFI